MNQDGTGLKFKIDDIIIHMESYRNYYLNDKELAEFEFVRELTDEEFYPMELLIHSHYKYPEIIVDVHKHTDNISNLDSKTNNIDSNYKAADEALDNKIGANTREINNVSGRVKTIEDSYVKSSDYNEKVSDIDSSISDISARLKTANDNIANKAD